MGKLQPAYNFRLKYAAGCWMWTILALSSCTIVATLHALKGWISQNLPVKVNRCVDHMWSIDTHAMRLLLGQASKHKKARRLCIGRKFTMSFDVKSFRCSDGIARNTWVMRSCAIKHSASPCVNSATWAAVELLSNKAKWNYVSQTLSNQASVEDCMWHTLCPIQKAQSIIKSLQDE